MAWLRQRAHWLLLGIAAIVLVAHSLAYNFVTDDAYISFVYSRNFAEHGELAFNLGDPVEGYTNFSWTVLLGLFMKLGLAPELMARVLGTICALGTLWLVTRIMLRALGRPSPWAALPALLLASSSGFACWTSGGLETQLFTVLVTAALDAVVAAPEQPHALRRVGWLLALAAMTRPEGPLIAAVLGAAWLVHVPLSWRERVARSFADELFAIGWFVLLWVPWFAWRWRYYGYMFPNTYYVKASGPWTDPRHAETMIDHGFYYIRVWLVQTKLVYVSPIAVLGLAVIRPRTPRFVLGVACALLLLAYIPYTISVGGDFMGLHRFIMPLFVVGALAVALGLEWLTAHTPWVATAVAAVLIAVAITAIVPWLLIPAVVLAVALAFVAPARSRVVPYLAVVALSAATQLELTRVSLDPRNLAADRGVIDTPAFLIVYTEDRAAIGKAMAPCFRATDFSIVGGAGAQPYYGRMRAIDVFGLVSERIAHEEPRRNPRAGHTKWGSEHILAGYHPDFVFSCYAIHATPAAPPLGCAGWWRGQGFEPVTMHIPGMRQQGEYYTFLARKARRFECPGLVH